MKTNVMVMLFVGLILYACKEKEPQLKEPVSFNVECKTKPHQYGGWYCPDNLNGFPPVNIADWRNVPVVNDRMPTKEETQNGTSLIYVDMEDYPNAKPLDMKVPMLATYYDEYSDKTSLVIIIQAVNISNDSIVGFRYLNGGNGSARLREVELLSNEQIDEIEKTEFVSFDVEIEARPDSIWKVLTKIKYATLLQETFDAGREMKVDWWQYTNVNFRYPNAGELKSDFAKPLFGNYYIQNDYENEGKSFVEKFLLLQDGDQPKTTMKVVVGPFGEDYLEYQQILRQWSSKVKELSEM